jgi:cytochrome c-type biogenesis protein CcmF
MYGALAACGLAIVLALRGSSRVRHAIVAAAIGAALATAALAWAMVTSDFSLAYVVDHSRRDASAPFRLAGVWGGMEGSLLLWVFALSVIAALVGRRPVVTAWLAAIAGAFLAVGVAFADPFTRLRAPAIEGAGLTPILEHPAMLYHPPLLYAGLATMSVPFALTLVALVRHELDEAWLASCRRWVVAGWTLLALGMVAGAHWAYAELGWGGFWAWDPVENTALLPFLAATAFLHAAQRQRVGTGTAALALGGFLLAALGTMLTRSGAAPSVHAFAEDRTIGRALAVLVVALAVVAAVALVRDRRQRRAADVGSGGWLTLQVALVGGVLAVVFAGTVEPLLAGLRGGDEVAVAGHFFATFTAPLALALLVAIGFVTAPRRWLAWCALLALVAVGIALAAGWREPFALAIAAASTFAGAAAVTAFVANPWRGGHVAHLGAAVLLAGIAGSTTGHSTAQSVAPGEAVALGGYEVRNDGVEVLSDPADAVARVGVTVTVLHGGSPVAVLHPELDVYRERGIVLPEASLRSTPFDDVQVLLRQADDDGRALLLVHVRPLVTWVWWGGLLVVAGGALSLSPSSRRPGGPRGPRASGRAGGRSSPVGPAHQPAPSPAARVAEEVAAPVRAARVRAWPARAPASTAPPSPATPPGA